MRLPKQLVGFNHHGSLLTVLMMVTLGLKA